MEDGKKISSISFERDGQTVVLNNNDERIKFTVNYEDGSKPYKAQAASRYLVRALREHFNESKFMSESRKEESF